MADLQVVGKYQIERALGQGGMGCVYEALDRELGRRVAIKMIRQEIDDEATRARFLREARAAAALTHPNACQLFEVSEHEGQPFLVMELLDGEALSTRLARGPLTTAEAAAVLLPLMDVMSAFHEQGLVHRDLKPSNVFITSRGVKLLDFGLARRTAREETLSATLVTSPGAVTGTMRYMAPEQITGDPIDARADIFALGVLLFEMLTGRIPFDAATNVDWLNSVLKDDPPSLGDPALATLDPIVMRALQRRPQDRYDSVAQMSIDFKAAIGDLAPAVARPDAASPPVAAVSPQAGKSQSTPPRQDPAWAKTPPPQSNAPRASSASQKPGSQASAPQARPASGSRLRSGSSPGSGSIGVKAADNALRMVVLPFRIPQDDDELSGLRDGIPEALTTVLASVSGLRVLSNRVAQEFGDATDLIAAGKELDVNRLLTGSVQRADDKIRVIVQFVDAADGAVLWSATSDHTFESAMALQDAVCAEVVSGLSVAAEGEETMVR
jgi:serine/threonine protein kinase